jgi:hypothetical protein
MRRGGALALAALLLSGCGFTSCSTAPAADTAGTSNDAAFAVVSIDRLTNYGNLHVLRHKASGACFVALSSDNGKSITPAPREVCGG